MPYYQDGRSEAAETRVSASAAPANVRLLYEMYTSNRTRTTHHTPSAAFRASPEQLMEGELCLGNVCKCCGTTSPPGGRRGRRRGRLGSALIKLTQSLGAHCEVYS